MRFQNPTRAAATLTFGMVVLVACAVGAQQLSLIDSDVEQTVKRVTSLVTKKHISHAEINDELSSRLFKRYLKTLDPQKLYFLQSDIEQLSRREFELDDALKAGNVSFASDTFNLYMARLGERMELVGRLIDAEYDFTIDEEIVVDPDDVDWAKSRDEVKDRWRKRIKYDLVTLKLDGTELAEARKRLRKRYHNIRQMMRQTEDAEKLEMYLTSLTHCLDPHSSYMSPQTLEQFRIDMELKLEGIGAALRNEDGYTVVAKIVEGGAADADGRLKVKDKIIGVDSNASGEFIDIVEMKLSKVVRYIRGPKGTVVRLQVKKADTDEIAEYDLTRRTIKLTQAEVKGEIIEAQHRLGRAGRIGVISIPSFYRDFRAAQAGRDFKSTRKDVLKVLDRFEREGRVDAVVVDLRYNGGGALSEAIEVSGLFVTEGPIVQVQEPQNRVKPHRDDDPEWYWRGPLMVLCNRMSASASEILAGAIKDYRRGIIVGDTTTHGKGTVQNVMPVQQSLRIFPPQNDLGSLKLTINQFFRVNGHSTQKEGVRSDIVLPSILEHRDVGEASLDNALAASKIRAASYAQHRGFLTQEIVQMLDQQSRQRRAASEKFQELEQEIKDFLKRKNRKTISLNEATLGAELDEARKKAEAENEEEDPTVLDDDEAIFREHYYNDEVLQIALDYVDLLKRIRTAGR